LALYDGTNPIEPYLGHPTYILDRDLADKAIAGMRMQHVLAPSKPWLLYCATATAHPPHNKYWIAKYRGIRSGQGQGPRGDTRPADEARCHSAIPSRPNAQNRFQRGISYRQTKKRLYAQMMEVYAGALSHADYSIARLLDAAEQAGQLDMPSFVA
jgi:arylsulfatase